MTSRRLFLAKLAGLAGFTLLSKAKGDYTKPLSLPVAFPVRATNIDYDRLLYCISAVETNHDDTVVGPCGARSRYQISEAVWRQHNLSSAPFLTGCRSHWGYWTARDHVRWLERQLRVYAWANPVWPIAWCWRGGLTAFEECPIVMRGHLYPEYSDYASRVTNLYLDPTYQHT